MATFTLYSRCFLIKTWRFLGKQIDNTKRMLAVCKRFNKIEVVQKISKYTLFKPKPSRRQQWFWFKHSKILIPIYVWVALNLIWTNFPRYVLIYLSIIDYEICSKIPHYFFIWPYLFKWHLRVALYKESSYLRRFRLYFWLSWSCWFWHGSY